MISEKELYDRYWESPGSKAFSWADKAGTNGEYLLRSFIVAIVFIVWLLILSIPGMFIWALSIPERVARMVKWPFQRR